MDAETRHQLKTNELAENLMRAREFFERNLNLILGLVAALVLLYVGYRLYDWRRTESRTRGWAEMIAVQPLEVNLGDAPLDQLRKIAAETSDPALRAVARTRLAAGLAVRAQALNEPARRDEAAKVLQEAIDAPDTPEAFRAAAMFKLASLSESARDLAKARETYQRLIDDPRFAGLPYGPLASQRLTELDELKETVEFTPGSAPPASQPTLTPTTATGALPTNDPALSPIATIPMPASAPATDASQPATTPEAPESPPPASQP